MTDAQTAWIVALAGGGVIGVLYFASLWWTVQRAARTSRPALLIAGSFLIRGVLAAALLVGVAGGDPWRVLGAVGVFLVVRTLAVRLAHVTVPSTPAHGPSSDKG